MTPPARRRSMQDLLDQQRGIETASEAAAVSPPSAGVTAARLPAPYSANGDGQLSERERSDLATCEAALDNLRTAFWAAGKALQVIRDASLYRNTHATFEDYLAERWEMSRAQAYRLIGAWPLAESLSPFGDKVNEAQIRELLPLAERHGQDAAITVYQTVAETEGVRITAAVLHDAIGILPEDHFDPERAAEQIRAYLASDSPAVSQPAADPVEKFTAEATKLLQHLHRIAVGRAAQAARDANPNVVRKVISDLRAVLDELEQGATSKS
jgi:hypothetical protein